VIRRQPTKKTKEEKARDARLQALAEDPYQAHEAWKRLSLGEKNWVVILMSKRYGQDFAKSFLWYTEHPVKRGYSISNQGEHTTDWFKTRGYVLQKTSQGAARDQFLEFWVHPSGYEIWQIVSGSKSVSAPTDVPPPETDCRELIDVTQSILDGAVATELSAQENLRGEKSRLEQLNKTTDAYCDRFNQYMGDLTGVKERIASALGDIYLLLDTLTEAKCSASGMDDKVDVLRELQIWADVESSPVMTQFLECIKLPPPKDMPSDDDS
jgi:hypothetical protein